ncbi:helix-turn-helix transcriptional regulator [Glutamicibacter sp. HZAU]|nr:helix-turn-helix transcriptional regulator [Glutamicibacter sp. HZAU]
MGEQVATALQIGGQASHVPVVTGNPDEYIVSYSAGWLNDALGKQGANGAVIRMGAHERHRHLIEEVIPLLERDAPEIRISCSKFSQSMGLGALLYMLSSTEAVDLSNDIQVFHWLKGEFARLSPPSPAKVIVEHAHLLDSRSERILSKLVASGNIQLILLTDQIENLGVLFSLLLRRRDLVLFNPFSATQEEFNSYIERRLAGRISAQVRAHYWARTHGDLGSLETLLDSDLERRVLRTERQTWVLDTTVAPQTEYLRSFDTRTVRLSASERQLLRRIEGQHIVNAWEFTDDKEQAKALSRLFILGLVENAGAGRIKSKYQAHPQQMVERRTWDEQGIYDSVNQGMISGSSARTCPGSDNPGRSGQQPNRLDNAEPASGLTPSSLETLAEFFAKMNVCDIAGAVTVLDLGGEAQTDDSELSIPRWYLAVRSGGWPQTPFTDDSTDGIVRCLNDQRWPDEATRIAGVLCVAYDWNLGGKLVGAERLVRWAVAELKRCETHLRDQRLLLWHPHVAFMVYSLSSNLCLWPVMDQMDELLDNSDYMDATAAGFREYFGAIRQLHHGRIAECQKALSAVIDQEQSSMYPVDAQVQQEVYALTSAMAGNRAQAGSLAVAGDETPSPAEPGHWSYSYARLLRRAYQNPDARLQNDLADYIQQALELGQNFSACRATSVSLALGFAMPRDQMRVLTDAMNDNSAHMLCALNEALLEKDEHLEVEIACAIASHGLIYHAALPLNRMPKGNTVLRRKLQRCIASIKSLDEEHPYAEISSATDKASRNIWHAPLTSRERSVAMMAARGLRNAELAEHFGISVRTVEGHLYQIHVKLGLRNRKELRALVENEQRGSGK